jgi:hypothetical protein
MAVFGLFWPKTTVLAGGFLKLIVILQTLWHSYYLHSNTCCTKNLAKLKTVITVKNGQNSPKWLFFGHFTKK